ncbi:AMP-binding protein [Chitinophaga sp. Hz27]|uniref:AMP-binding protein n=1 Tax=Chitinophaga sp. Hz27 TaxID=3347169 RepID=UPI0035D9A256
MEIPSLMPSCELLPMQEAILFDCALNGSHEIYTIEVPMRWEERNADPERIYQAFKRAVLRHDTFRVSIKESMSESFAWKQTILPVAHFSENILFAADERAPIDPSVKNEVSLLITERKEDHISFILRFHHVIADRKSIELLVYDIVAFYTGNIPPSAGNYHDAIHRLLTSVQQLEIQQNEHMPATAVAQSPARITNDKSLRVQRCDAMLNITVWNQLENIAREAALTPQALIMAAFYIALSRLEGRCETTVGIPFSLHDLLPEAHTAGCFINVLPLTLSYNPALSFIQFADSLQQQLSELLPYRLQSLLRRSSNSGTPNNIYDAVFAWHDALIINQKNVQVELGIPNAYPSRLACSLLVQPVKEGLQMMMDYDPDKIAPLAATSLLNSVWKMLEVVALHREIKLTNIALADAPLYSTAVTSSFSVIHEISKQMDRNPSAVAVIDATQRQYTYADLQHSADAITAWALALPLTGKEVIALCIPRSFEFIAALVGMISTGKPFALLDPDANENILAACIQSGSITHVLTDNTTRNFTVKTTRVDYLINNPVEQKNRPDITPGNIMLFTSGTTGMPKPIWLPLTKISDHARWAIKAFSLQSSDRMLQFCAVSFDAMLEEVLPALAVGAALVLRDQMMAASVTSFITFCEQHKVSVIDLPTGFFNLAGVSLAANDDQLPVSLRLVVIGGEGYNKAAAEAWLYKLKQSNSSARLLTTYGPAEASIVVTSAALHAPIEEGLPLLGSPREGVTMYVLDKDLQPMPKGFAGDLFIGGEVLAHGYFQRPVETAFNFIPDPFSTVPGASMYRTGDRVIINEKGELVFAGRADRQLKRRGMRIAIDEIENVFSKAFHGARCAALPYGNNQEHLGVFIQHEAVSNKDQSVAAALAMLPAIAQPTVMRFQPLPLTERGKVDYKVLLNELEALTVTHTEIHQHNDPAWQLIMEVLGRTTLQPQDDFFLEGGHSLAVLRLIGLADSRLNKRVHVRDIYQARSIESIAQIIHGAAVTDHPKPTTLDPWDLTPMEWAILADEQLSGDAAYWIEDAWTINQQLCGHRFKKAMTTLLAAHPMLRARLVSNDAGYQWQDSPLKEAVDRALGITNTDRSFLNIRLDNSQPHLTTIRLRAHHSLLDGKGIAAFMTALADTYSRNEPCIPFIEKYPPLLPEASSKDIWENYLSALENIPSLPGDRHGDRFLANAVSADFDTGLNIKDFSGLQSDGRSHFPLFAAMTTAWLHRMTSKAQVAMSIATSIGQHIAGIRLSTVVVPLFASITPTTTLYKVYDHSKEQLDWLLDNLPADPMHLAALLRNKGVEHMMPVLFSFQDDTEQQPILRFDGGAAYSLVQQVNTVRADVEISVKVSKDGHISCNLRGRESLYSQQLLAHWVASLGNYIVGLLQHPTELLAAVPLIPFNHSAAAMLENKPDDAVIHYQHIPSLLRDIFKQQGDIAVVKNGTVSFTGLALINHTDKFLTEFTNAGVEPGDCIAVILPRTVWYVPVLMAIWEAGAVPVLINPEQPHDRQQSMIRQTQPSAKVMLERGSVVITAMDTRSLKSTQQVNTAYISFTSGSTGEPKPVICGWKGIAYLLGWSVETFGLSQEDVFLHTASTGFDISIWEMLFPLLCKARLLVAEAVGVQNLPEMVRLIEKEQVTHVHFIPGILESLLNAMSPNEGRSIRMVFCGGEAVPPALLKRLLEERNIPLQHCYGPTEASIFMLSWKGNQPSPWPHALPLGSPVNGAGVVILDDALNPVVRGVAGQIGIYGFAVTEGYLGRPFETAKVFRPWSGLGGRIYLTGDHAKMHANGDIEYIGRDDRQVKIAGVRIELGEIEHILSTVKGVQRAMVFYKSLPNKTKALVAYIRYEAGAELTTLLESLQGAALQGLPAAVVPKYYVLLAEFPLNINGKIDVKQLPEPAILSSENKASAELLNQEEAILKDLWSAVLKQSHISADDNFFRIGGDSMNAIQITALARKSGIVISLADFFRYPSIRQMASVLKSRMQQQTVAAIAPGTVLVPGEAAQHFLCTVANPAKAGVQTVLLTFTSPVAEERLLYAWNQLLSRHDAFSMLLKETGNGWRLVTGIPSHLTEIALASDLEAAKNSISEQISPQNGKMVGVVRLQNNPATIVIGAHHLAIDIHSWYQVIRELQLYYQEGEKTHLPAIPASYAQWSLNNEQVITQYAIGRERMHHKTILPQRVYDNIKQAGAQRTSLMLGITAQALATHFGLKSISIALEQDGRHHVKDGADYGQTVGWMTTFKHATVSVNEPSTAAWQAAATAALKEAVIGSSAEYVLNIVTGFDNEADSAGMIDFLDADTTPSHTIAIEFLLEENNAIVVVDCDAALPATTAAAISTALAQSWSVVDGNYLSHIPLTTFQESILSACLRYPDAGLYHTQILFELQGDIDTQLLKKAWQHTATMHDVFAYSVNIDQTPDPVFTIVNGKEICWNEITALDTDIESLCNKTLEYDIHQPFNLLTGDMSRLYLLRAKDGQRLLWSHHHLFFDGWSLNLVISDVGKSYQALNDNSRLPAPAPVLATYNNWWCQQSQEDILSRWFGKYRKFKLPNSMKLPVVTDQKQYVSDFLRLSTEDTVALNQLARQHHASMFEIILAAWSLVMVYQLRQREILFGVVLTIRPPEIQEVSSLAGCCMNTLPFYVTVPDALSALMDAVRSSFGEILEDITMPTGRLFTALRQDGWDTKLETLVVFENYPGDRTGTALGQAGRLKVLGSRERNEIPFTLVALGGDECEFELLFQDNSIHRATAKRLLLQLERTLKTFVSIIQKQ